MVRGTFFLGNYGNGAGYHAAEIKTFRDINAFRTNEAFQLQLNSEGSGNSFIVTNSQFLENY